MRIERVDDYTVKCFLSNEDLAEYNLEYKDFIEHTDKAKELVHEIMEQATEEVGYKPPEYAFDLQIMVVPEHGLVLTLSERDQDDPDATNPVMAALQEMKRLMQKNKEGAEQKNNDKTVNKPNKKREAASRPEEVTFVFGGLGDVMDLAALLPKTLRVESTLYKMKDAYYLHIRRGGAAYDKFSRTCIQAMEFAAIAAADSSMLPRLQEHAECLIAENALKKLRG